MRSGGGLGGRVMSFRPAHRGGAHSDRGPFRRGWTAPLAFGCEMAASPPRGAGAMLMLFRVVPRSAAFWGGWPAHGASEGEQKGLV